MALGTWQGIYLAEHRDRPASPRSHFSPDRGVIHMIGCDASVIPRRIATISVSGRLAIL